MKVKYNEFKMTFSDLKEEKEDIMVHSKVSSKKYIFSRSNYNIY